MDFSAAVVQHSDQESPFVMPKVGEGSPESPSPEVNTNGKSEKKQKPSTSQGDPTPPQVFPQTVLSYVKY